MENTQPKITKESFIEGEHSIKTEENGKKVTKVLLSTGEVATVRKGKGKDVEKATMIANGDQSKYLTALMACVTSVEDRQLIAEEIGEFDMDDYMHLQVAFSELNF